MLDAELYGDFRYTGTGPKCSSCGGPMLSDEGITLNANGVQHSSCSQTFRHQLRAWEGKVKRPVGGLVKESVAIN